MGAFDDLSNTFLTYFVFHTFGCSHQYTNIHMHDSSIITFLNFFVFSFLLFLLLSPSSLNSSNGLKFRLFISYHLSYSSYPCIVLWCFIKLKRFKRRKVFTCSFSFYFISFILHCLIGYAHHTWMSTIYFLTTKKEIYISFSFYIRYLFLSLSLNNAKQLRKPIRFRLHERYGCEPTNEKRKKSKIKMQ